MSTRITGLSARNYKGVREIELHPTGNVVVIGGKNGEGKSSFIDAIAEIIDPKGTKLTSRPIRDGESRAEASITTDEWVATRVWTRNDGGSLTVKAHDGAVYSTPATFIRELVGAVPFDPEEFARLDDKKQREEILARVELPFDLDELTARRKRVYDGRTDANREVKRLTAHLASMPTPDPNIPTEELSAAALIEKISNARILNQQRESGERYLARLDQEISDLEERLTTLRAQREAGAQAMETIPPAVDVADLETQLGSIEQTNQAVRSAQTWRAVDEELQTTIATATRLSTELDEIDRTKAEGLASATFPFEGLSVDDEGVLVHGVPFRQVNSADKVKVAFDLMTSAMPELRIVQIRNGSLLDSDSLAYIERVAAERDYLVLIERVDETGEVGFTVRDGAIV
jgi:energy-coupling factor transporter ATP-binding protein EcfA2